MGKNCRQFDGHFLGLEPPSDLLLRIMERVKQEQRLLALKRRLVILASCCIAAAAGIVPAFLNLRVASLESGFLEFLKLGLSDLSSVVIYPENFLMALLESLPVMSLVVFFLVILVGLGSFRLVRRYWRDIHGQSSAYA